MGFPEQAGGSFESPSLEPPILLELSVRNFISDPLGALDKDVARRLFLSDSIQHNPQQIREINTRLDEEDAEGIVYKSYRELASVFGDQLMIFVYADLYEEVRKAFAKDRLQAAPPKVSDAFEKRFQSWLRGHIHRLLREKGYPFEKHEIRMPCL